MEYGYLCNSVPMYIDIIPNRDSPPCILLRESIREGSRIIKRTIANITNWPNHVVDAIKISLKEGGVIGNLENAFEIIRSRAHGHVVAVLGTLRKIGLDKLISSKSCEAGRLVSAMITARVIAPYSKLATARCINDTTLSTSLGQELGIEQVGADQLYAALDWLQSRQERIQKKLIGRHVKEPRMLLYDLSSSYFEGRHCPIARYGHSRDHRPDKLQIEYGLICNNEGCPVAIEVFEGNTADPKTFTAQVQKFCARYGINCIVWIGDRGMITNARIEEDLRGQDGLDWITALRSSEIQSLITNKALRLSAFEKDDVVEIQHSDYPNERLIACKNILLAQERSRKRDELLAATEKSLNKLMLAVQRVRCPLRGKEKITLKLGKIISRYKMEKHFNWVITETSFQYSRNQDSINSEKNLDGIYVIRTSVKIDKLSTESAVLTYKNLSKVERAFRSLKTVDLRVRPIFHYKTNRVKAHIFLCMLAYYVEWHMRQKLAPILFDDDDKESAQAQRQSVVAPAQRSSSALLKAKRKLTSDGFPVHSFRSLLCDLQSIVKNTLRPKIKEAPTFDKVTLPTALQKRALQLLQIDI